MKTGRNLFNLPNQNALQTAPDDGQPVYDVSYLVRGNNLAEALAAGRMAQMALRRRMNKKKKPMPAGETKTASVPDKWIETSPFCAAYLLMCKQSKMTQEEITAGIMKTAAVDGKVAQEWQRFFEQIN